MFSVTIYTYVAGDLAKLKAPLDADLNFCGVGNLANYPDLYITDLKTFNVTNMLTSGVCV